MKRITLYIALFVSCSWLAMLCLAQSLDERIKNIYAPLEKGEIQSGILIHQTPIFLWPGRYDGHNKADSVRLSLDQFGILYGQFCGASIGSPVLPEPDIYLDERRRTHKETIMLAALMMQYGYVYVRPGARDDHLLDWNNGQLHDVSGRSQSPYLQDTCFAMTVLQ